MTKPTTGFEHPNPSIFVIIRGSTDSDDDVLRTISNSSLIYAKYFHKLNLYNLQIKFKTIKQIMPLSHIHKSLIYQVV